MAYLQNRPSGMLGGTPARVKWTELDSEKLRALRIFLLYRRRERAVFRPVSPWGAMAMTDEITSDIEREGPAALALMEEALARLDRCDSGLEVGAQLDLAICRLRSVLGLAEHEVMTRIHHYEPDAWSSGSDSCAA